MIHPIPRKYAWTALRSKTSMSRGDKLRKFLQPFRSQNIMVVIIYTPSPTLSPAPLIQAIFHFTIPIADKTGSRWISVNALILPVAKVIDTAHDVAAPATFVTVALPQIFVIVVNFALCPFTLAHLHPFSKSLTRATSALTAPAGIRPSLNFCAG